MIVSLIQHFPDALELLLFTKQTRLRQSPVTLEAIRDWPEEKKMAELDYMLGTINSSWEFSEYLFVIEDVTRAFTHQLVRHRAGVSFAQQAQRVVDMSDFDYETGPSILIDMDRRETYDAIMGMINKGYQELLQQGVNPQDARGVLPTNIDTNIVMKANLRTLHEMGKIRLCVKAQGEYQDVFRAMRSAVLDVHPWASRFIKVHCAFHGTCAFPSFPTSDCPVKPLVYDPVQREAYGGGRPASLEQIEQRWLWNRAEAQPVVGASVNVELEGGTVIVPVLYECTVCGYSEEGLPGIEIACTNCWTPTPMKEKVAT